MITAKKADIHQLLRVGGKARRIAAQNLGWPIRIAGLLGVHDLMGGAARLGEPVFVASIVGVPKTYINNNKVNK